MSHSNRTIRNPVKKQLMVGIGFASLMSPVLGTAQEMEFVGPPAPILQSGGRWDAQFGGVPRKGLWRLETGFSELSRLSYQHSVAKDLAIGGAVRFDYGHWAPSDSFSSAVGVSAPIRYGLVHRGRWTVGLEMEPGLYLGLSQPRFSQTIVGLNLGLGAAIGYRWNRWLTVGGGIETPILFGLPTNGRDAFVTAPLLVGPIAEARIHSHWSVTADVKVGPHFITDDFFGTRFGVLAMVGLAYRM